MTLGKTAWNASWWSLPLGLAEGVRVAHAGLLHNSLFAASFRLRALGSAAAVLLFYGVLAYIVALAVGLVARVVLGERISRNVADVGVLIMVEGGLFLVLLSGGVSPPRILLFFALLGAVGAGGFLIWRRAPGRASGSWLYCLATLLHGSALLWTGLFSMGTGVIFFIGIAAVLGAATWLGWPGRVLPLVALTAALLVVVVVGASLPQVLPLHAASAALGSRPVLLVTVDTLRADALSAATTPHLDRLAQEGIRFTRAYAPSPWTIPSIYSLLTSRLPHEIGMTGQRKLRLDDAIPRLPQILPAGFAKRAVVTNVFGASRWGSWTGFDSVESGDLVDVVRDSLLRGLILPRLVLGLRPLRYPMTEARADRITDQGLRHLEALDGGSFLLWLHYYDPHTPYDPPAPFDTEVGPPRSKLSGIRKRSLAFLRSGMKLDAGDRAHIKALYEGEVRYTDAAIGRLWDGLQKLGLWDDALIIVAADHGEEFWEHGSVEHGHTLYEELIHVPLLVKLPGSLHAGRVIEDPVSLLDIVPTILDVLGHSPAEELVMRGRTLLPSLERAEAAKAPGRSLYFEAVVHYRELKGVLDAPWKLIHDPETGADQLFNLEEDAAERINRAVEEEDRLQALRAWIEPYLQAEQALAEPDSIDPELLRRLKALGYLQ